MGIIHTAIEAIFLNFIAMSEEEVIATEEVVPEVETTEAVAE